MTSRVYSRDYPWGCFLVERVLLEMSGMAPFRSKGIPLEAQYLYRQALDIRNDGKKEEALKYLKMAISIAPHYCNAYNAMGNCLDEMGRYEEAIKKYEKVLELNPQHTEARFKREMIQKKIVYEEEIPFCTGLSLLLYSP